MYIDQAANPTLLGCSNLTEVHLSQTLGKTVAMHYLELHCFHIDLATFQKGCVYLCI